MSSAAVVGEIVDARTVALTEDDWRAFESALSTAGFWTMPSLSHGGYHNGEPGIAARSRGFVSRDSYSVSRLNLEVNADAEHKAVELEGLAYTQLQRTRAVELARSTRPDIVVQDKIDVKPYEIPRDLFDDNMMADVKADAGKMGDKLGDSLDDGWVHMKVVAKLIADFKTPERTINVDVANNVVTLRGAVPSPEIRAQAESIAKGVDGVKDVKNRLVVKKQ